MSSPELIYLAPECHEQGERLWCADDVWGSCHEHDGEHCEESHPSVRYVRGDLHDALAQRCRELEAEIGPYRDIAYARVDECAALRAEVADLKARLLEAERGAEELVRLRAEKRDLRKLLAECADYLNYNELTSIGHGSILHRKMTEAACASTDGATATL